ncbi:MAG: hypothetical protein HY744_14600 [Deltaproteobacteria bacterium]|nr:hypothetical protein [Deltaproteobacteria bacterium]
MKKAKGLDARIAPGHTGQFDVLVDGACLFSKEETGRFPSEAEIIERL